MAEEKKKKRRLVKPLLLGAIGLAALIQLVPYGRSHDNPPVTAEPQWDSPETQALVKRACYDCHSNETKWPWYSNVAPVSWLVQNDVNEGREHLNFSEWDRRQKHADDAAEEVRDGEMPLWVYLPAHPEARLTDAEKQQLITGLEATFGKGDKGGEHDD
ncbi:MAG: heme-binding domain-containing protein [Planctomycetes bacterium]|nr:heme-binding domain-containing protein [Planctomycetota bacterium]